MKIEMNDEWRAKWVAALRSGKYEQATGELQSPYSGGFCCLGVLCDISEAGRWSDDEDGVLGYYLVDGIRDREHVPGPLAKEMGLSSLVQQKLAELNDNGASFEEIADIIERDGFAQEELGETNDE